jgi:para-aminobenzoate synthetase/4-amino-4-deoxychorismate lyase
MNRRQSLPAEVYSLVDQTPATVLLECGKPDACQNDTNLSQLFVEPVRVCAAYTPAEVQELFAAIEVAVASGLCAAGYFTYECGNCFEPKAGLHTLPPGRPLAWFGIYERSYRFNHDAGRFEDGEPAQLSRFRGARKASAQDASTDVAFSLTQAQYTERIDAIHELIRAGDVYQLNYTAPFTLHARGELAALYAQLCARQPVEYAAFIHAHSGHRILSFSPELFFRIDKRDGERRITTQPMKGTVARGRTTAEDRARAEWLRNDAKNRAENLMIVDLLRNDLGRLAKFGTVRTEDMFAVERYSTLWQMTSTVTGDLRPEAAFGDIFRALFPCGSVTGAPKVHAMQLLAQLEGQPRGVYTGAIGFFSPQQTVFNVAIRTLEMVGNEGIMGVGSGIVIDSVAAEEFAECQLKAQFLISNEARSLTARKFSDQFQLIESLLWDGGYPLIELHLDRLEDSAEYFGFSCNRAEVKSALIAHAQAFTDGERRKVRLLLSEDGEVSIGSEAIVPTEPNSMVRIRVAALRADSADKWLYHKTTHRNFYQTALQQEPDDDFDELIFLNERGEVTEGAISNIFVEKNGRMYTPPIECGLLAGVYRRHLIETRQDVEERILTLEDLCSADAVFICNAVRGLRRAQIESRLPAAN